MLNQKFRGYSASLNRKASKLLRSFKLASNLFIIIFLLLQVVLIIRCYFAGAKLLGWQMFLHGTIYRTEFYGIDPDGTQRPLPESHYGSWIVGTATYLKPRKEHQVFTRGRGFLLEMMEKLPPFLCRKLAGRGYQRIRVEVEHRDVTEPAMTQSVYESVCEKPESPP